MNIRQLEYFMLTAECRNVTEAAERLHMAQPPLSRALKNLEEELGVTLFSRSNRGVRLTDAGRLLYDEAKPLFRQIENIQTVVRESSNGLCGCIKIGACYSTLPIVTQKMSIFLEQHPSCTFSMLHGTISELESWLRDGTIDVLFLRNCIVESADFVHVTLPDDPLCLVIHQSLDACPTESTVDISYLKDLPLCLLDETRFPKPNSELFGACKKQGFSPRIICTCYDNSAGLALALNAIAATFLPVSSVTMNRYDELHVKTIRYVDLTSCPTMIYNPGIYHTKSVDAFLSMFSAHSD